MRKFIKSQKTSYGIHSAKKKELDHAVMRFIVRDLQPLSVVDDVGFNELIHVLDSRYALPSRKHIRDVLLQNMYNNTKERLTKILSSVK